MKDMMPLPVTTTASPVEASGASAVAAGLGAGQNGAAAVLSPDSPVKTASFQHSLQSLLSAENAPLAASSGSLAGGNDLPLATELAITDPPAASLLPAELRAMQDLDLQELDPQQGPMLMPQTLASQTDTYTDTRAALQPVSIAVPGLTQQVVNTSEQLDSTRQSMPDVKQVNIADLIENEAAFRDRPRARPLTIAVHGSLTATQPEQLSIEADPLMKMQLQVTAAQLPEQLVANKRLLESMVSGNQPDIDSLHTAMARTAVASAATISEPLVSTSHQATISQTLTHADWGQGMSKQVMLLVNQNIRSAELRLNPANLGPIEIRIDMDEEMVNVSFSSKHAVVREAVEQALPRLREMFNENGLSLGDADISQHSFAEQRAGDFEQASEQQAQFPIGQPTTGETQELTAENAHITTRVGLVDYFI